MYDSLEEQNFLSTILNIEDDLEIPRNTSDSKKSNNMQ